MAQAATPTTSGPSEVRSLWNRHKTIEISAIYYTHGAARNGQLRRRGTRGVSD